MFQVKPARAGSSIGVTVAYGFADSLSKANAIITQVVFFLGFLFVSPYSPKCFEKILCSCMNLDHVGLEMTMDRVGPEINF